MWYRIIPRWPRTFRMWWRHYLSSSQILCNDSKKKNRDNLMVKSWFSLFFHWWCAVTPNFSQLCSSCGHCIYSGHAYEVPAAALKDEPPQTCFPTFVLIVIPRTLVEPYSTSRSTESISVISSEPQILTLGVNLIALYPTAYGIPETP